MLFLRESARQKNHFFCQNFSKSAKKRLFPKENLAKIGGKTVLWESAKNKNEFGRPKKKKGRQNFGKFFENPPPPLEKILDPPLLCLLNFEIWKSGSLEIEIQLANKIYHNHSFFCKS